MSEQISFETVDDADEAIMNAASELFGAIQRKSIWDDRLRLTKSQLVAEAVESVEGIAGDRRPGPCARRNSSISSSVRFGYSRLHASTSSACCCSFAS